MASLSSFFHQTNGKKHSKTVQKHSKIVQKHSKTVKNTLNIDKTVLFAAVASEPADGAGSPPRRHTATARDIDTRLGRVVWRGACVGQRNTRRTGRFCWCFMRFNDFKVVFRRFKKCCCYFVYINFDCFKIHFL